MNEVCYRAMRRSVRINLDQDLPVRPAPLGEDAISQVFGGCVRNNGSCRYDHDCCLEYLTDNRGGVLRLGCYNPSGANGTCRFQYMR